MRVVVAGGTGFLGRRLCAALVDRGDAVVVLSRDPQQTKQRMEGSTEVLAWDPSGGTASGGWVAAVGSAQAVINLAGENIGGRGPIPTRWSPALKHELRSSRLQATRTLVSAIAATDPARRPHVLVNASAAGYYGDRGDELLTEQSTPGDDFLANLCVDWEAAAITAEALGVRVVRLRTGVVLDHGALASDLLVLTSRLGVAGPLGNGRQWWSWIHRDDVVGLILHALDTEAVSGAMNAAAPAPRQMRDFPVVLGNLLHRPAWLPTPAFALRLAFGDLADALLLASQRVAPERALNTGYAFRFHRLEDAFRDILASTPGGANLRV
jgi:uncharacterized protein (TIGR01777 family)